MPNKEGESKRDKALRISVKEGAMAHASTNISETYITPFALALQAQPVQIGLLSSLPGLIGPLAALKGSTLMERYRRKKIVLTAVLLQALMFIPILLLGLFPLTNGTTSIVPYLLVIGYTCMAVLGSMGYPAWFSWMGDLVPEETRGKYFSMRSRTVTLAGLVAVTITGFILDIFKTKGYVLIGFCILFLIAGLARLGSYYTLKKQYEPKLKIGKKDYFSIILFLKRKDNFSKFTLYLAFLYAAITIASPFFPVYMLEVLKFDYVTFMMISISSTIVIILALPFAGLFSDRYGNIRLLMIASTFYILTPILWIFIKNPFWIMSVQQVSAGIANAALAIASTNFIYDAVKPKQRALYVSYNNILVGCGIFVGSMIGGLILKTYHPSFLQPFIFLFIVTAIARLAVCVIGIPLIKEVRKVKSLPPLSLEVTHPWKALHTDLSWFKHIFR